MPKPKHQTILKPYNIVIDAGGNTARIDLYGEVVSTRPVDWWTGKPIPGNFIAQDEFLKDLSELAGKDEVTVHINSVGGDLYAGIAIYHRLKGLAAHVTTINDGLAASAGSLIFMAGDDRKMHAGSNLMIHGAAGFLFGYYQVQDLRSAEKQLEAHNQAGINIYAERTGRDKAEITALVEAETWMTGDEAVSEGFATETIADEAEPVEMKLTPDRTTMMVNGYPVAARCMGKIPDSVPVMSADEWAQLTAPKNHSAQPAPVQDHANTNKHGGTNMEINNLDALRAAFPDLVAQAEAAAQAKGCAEERARIQGIEDIDAAIGDAELVQSAKYGDKPMNAEQLAFAAMKKQAAIGAHMLNKLTADAQNSGAAGVAPTPTPGTESKAQTDDEKAEALLLGRIQNKQEDK